MTALARRQGDKEKEMKTGTIVVFNAPRSWGFVREVLTNEEYFFHCDNCPGFNPYLEAYVQFDVAAPLRIGLKVQAIKLRPVEDDLYMAFMNAEGGVK